MTKAKNIPAVQTVLGIELDNALHIGQCAALLDGSNEAMVSAFASMLGTKPTFEAWEGARTQWRVGYAEQRDMDMQDKKTAGALDTAWSRFAAKLSEAFGLTKPKATTAAAQAKAEQRKADPVKTMKPEELRAKREELHAVVTADPKNVVAMKDYVRVIDAEAKLEKAAAKEIAKTESEQTAKRRAVVRDYLKAAPADVLALFECLMDATRDGNSDQAKAHAAAQLVNVLDDKAAALSAKVAELAAKNKRATKAKRAA